jgi:hypothetical protein
LRADLTWGDVTALRNLQDELWQRVCLEGASGRETLVENDAERVDVGLRIDGSLPVDLLR